MQICQHCARPTTDPACTCHHASDTKNEIHGELRDLDASLSPPPSAEPPLALEWPPAPEPRLSKDALASSRQRVQPAPSPEPPLALKSPPSLDEPVSPETPVSPESLPSSEPAPSLERPLSTAHTAAPLVAASQPANIPPAPPLASGRQGSKRRPAVIIAALFVAGGIGLMVARPSLRPDAPVLKAATSPVRTEAAPAPAAAPPVSPVESSGAPKWVRARQSWATDGSRIVGLELAAESDVRVWMKHVRPVLAVRCLGGQVESFVITESAASIEPVPDQHTVRVSFDGQGEREERWIDSESKTQLFAPDGAALADQLSRAHTMRFGFTPYGAQPVAANFDVHGFVPPACGSAKGKAVSRIAHQHGR